MKKICTCILLFVCSCSVLLSQSLTLKDAKYELRYDGVNFSLAKPVFSWKLLSEAKNVMQEAYAIKVATDLRSLRSGKNLVWNTGKISGDKSIAVPYKGEELKSRQTYYWQVTVWDNKGKSAKSEIQQWTCGLQESDWEAQWIQRQDAEADGQVVSFRKIIEVGKPIEKAELFITSRGIYEAEINGEKVGNQLFTPGFTSYRKRIQYQQYDITKQLTAGKNVLVVGVSEGWYKGPLLGGQHFFGNKVALLSQIEITYKDGSRAIVPTDASWKASVDGAVVLSGIYKGEVYDARKKKNVGSIHFTEDTSWSNAVLSDNQSHKELVASIATPVARHETIKPQNIFVTPAGETVIDFGQNLIGRIRFQVEGQSGDSLLFSHAEVLDRDGNFYTRNLRTAKQQLIYYLRGGETESYEPIFTFQGFRYLRIEGNKELITKDNIDAVVIHSDMSQTGQFSTSNDLLNQLQHNILWGQKGNFLDIPTDCPQRDERLGWTGDAEVFFKTSTFNMDVSSFFVKWLADVRADQLDNGGVPGVVPNIWGTGENNIGQAGWADAITIIPWQWYRIYGDRQMLEDCYPAMLKWAGYIAGRSTDNLWDRSWHHGDWLHYMPNNVWDKAPAYTDKTLLAQAFYVYTLQNIINTAQVLGKDDDVRKYGQLLQKVKDRFVQEFVTPAGAIMSNTQTAYVLALQFDILPQEMRAEAARRLVKLIEAYDYHISTGFLGTPHICHVLSRFGYEDVAYRLLMQETFPSWLYPVKKGATTIWERWDGIKPDGSFQDEAMNSFNHYAYGAIGEWMYKNIGGLDQQEGSVGYKNIIISPKPGGGITKATIGYESVYGKVACVWEIKDGRMTMSVQIPPNADAQIIFPDIRTGDVRESDKVQVLNSDGKSVNLGSGKYDFVFNVE